MSSTPKKTWMIYGATGYTGNLIIQEAMARGHKPIIAGRNLAKLEPLSERYKLESLAIDLNDTPVLEQAVAAVDLVFHVAGPYVRTAEPMMQACIKGKTHYVDITGEAPVFERCFELNDAARAAGICLVSGIGFDVIPTDCLLAHVAAQVSNVNKIEMAIAPKAQPSPGTLKSALGIMRSGKAAIRYEGAIKQLTLGSIVKEVRFPSGKQTVALSPIADVYTAYYSTGAKNIQVYMAQAPLAAKLMKYFAPLISFVLSNNWAIKKLEHLIDQKVQGPKVSYRNIGYAEVWARAENKQGKVVEAGLRTGEVYFLTSQLSIRFIEKVLLKNPKGSLAPAQLFSMSDLLDIKGVKLFDEKGNSVQYSSNEIDVAISA